MDPQYVDTRIQNLQIALASRRKEAKFFALNWLNPGAHPHEDRKTRERGGRSPDVRGWVGSSQGILDLRDCHRVSGLLGPPLLSNCSAVTSSVS